MTTPADGYRAVFCDLRSDQVMDAFSLTEVQFDDYIGKTGSLTATLPLPDAALAARARAALLPGRTAVWLERGAEIWWGGVLWTSTPSGDERGRTQVQIQAGTFDSYLDHRIFLPSQDRADIGTFDGGTFEGDQFDIARRLIDNLQQARGGDIGIVYGTEVSGVRRSRKVDLTELSRGRELLDSLAGMEDGFEWRVHCYRDPGTGRRVKLLQLGHPVITVGQTDIVLDRPGPVLAYSLPEDATLQANFWIARGESPNRNQTAKSVPSVSTVPPDESDLKAGWPRLDGSSDHSAVTDVKVLNELARAQLARARRPQTIPEITLRVDGRVTPALLGAGIRLRVHDLWHAEGTNDRYRVVGLAVTPPVRGQYETAKLYLERF
ncbi:hypothetical protein [Streptomyces albireticuli]|uniref:hypothetical protein n=1 Tax=Streptomyces albireticuli TaxID=1940 RepID=UPI0036ACF848